MSNPKTSEPTPKGSCPPPPSMNQKSEDISNMLKGMGGDQKCHNTFSNAVHSGLTTDDAAAVVVTLGGGGGGTNNFTQSQNDLKTNMTKDGCTDLCANINTQMNAQQSVLCQLNNTQNTTSLAGSARATISLIQQQPDANTVALRKALIASLGPPPERPQYIPGVSTPTSYQISQKNFEDQLKTRQAEINSIMGAITFTNVTIKNKANVDMKAMSNTQSINTTQLADHFKAVAKAQALSDMKEKSGMGADSPQLKSLIDQKITNKNQSITNSIKNTISSTKLSGSASTGFSMIFTGPLNMTDVIIDQYAQTRIASKNIVTSATNMGKSIASDILSSSSSSNKTSSDDSGEAALLKQIYQGQANLVKQNTAGVDKVMGDMTSMFSMFMIIPIVIGVGVIMFVPEVGDMLGPLKYVLIAAVIYLIAAYFFGFWPFSKSEKYRYYSGGPHGPHLAFSDTRPYIDPANSESKTQMHGSTPIHYN